MHLRINDVTVSPARVDELGDVLSNKALPVVRAQKGYRACCARPIGRRATAPS